MDEPLLDNPIVDSYDVAEIFKPPHDFVLSEIDALLDRIVDLVEQCVG